MASDETDQATPLLSNSFLLKLTMIIGLLAALTAGLTMLGKLYGDALALGEHTPSRELYRITVGQDLLSLPANMIRFAAQRRDGEAGSVDLYLSWPEFDGYTPRADARFSDPGGAQDLVFLQFSQSVMSRDMSGRLEPIYKRLFRGQPETGPAGLILHRLDPKSGFDNEAILTGMTRTGGLYVVRCRLPAKVAEASTADCQRDVHVGHDLNLLYRFSSTLLPAWEELDGRILAFAKAHIADAPVDRP